MKGRFYNLLFLYTNWIVQNYQLVSRINSLTPSLKIIDEGLAENKEDILFTIQLSGKNIFPKLTARELVKDKTIFVNFGEEDRQKILAALPHERCPILQRILARTYDRVSKQFLFTIELLMSDKTECLSALEIAQKFKNLGGFDEKDAFLIGLEMGKILN